MSQTASGIAEAYLARFRAELGFLGAAETDDLVAEIRSLLADAAGADTDRMTAEIERLGPPADLAAGILAERGLAAEQGMSTAEWWRMGTAVPVDIIIGVAVPLAVAVPAYLIASQGRPPAWAAVLAAAAALIALAWPWYVWRPWRTGGPRVTPGMALTGLAVVRAPRFRRVVRTKDFAGMGMRLPVNLGALGLLIVAGAAVALSAAWTLTYTIGSSPASLDAQHAVIEGMAGPRSEQRQQAMDTVAVHYESLQRFGSDDFGTGKVLAPALGPYAVLVARAKTERLIGYRIGEPVNISTCAWRVPVVETTSAGTHHTEWTVVLQLTIQPGSIDSWAWSPDWLTFGITGDGLPAAQ